MGSWKAEPGVGVTPEHRGAWLQKSRETGVLSGLRGRTAKVCRAPSCLVSEKGACTLISGPSALNIPAPSFSSLGFPPVPFHLLPDWGLCWDLPGSASGWVGRKAPSVKEGPFAPPGQFASLPLAPTSPSGFWSWPRPSALWRPLGSPAFQHHEQSQSLVLARGAPRPPLLNDLSPPGLVCAAGSCI